MIPLSQKGDGPLFRRVYAGLREAILAGSYAPGERLPSTRELAARLGISRTVALTAYELLLAEGFVTGRAGSGTYVSADLGRVNIQRPVPTTEIKLSRFGRAAATVSPIDAPQRGLPSMRYNFSYGRSNLEIFPFETWRRILLRQARQASARKLGYGPATGSIALREAICAHVRRSRAVVCDPSDIIVVNGSQQALDLIARVLVERGDPVVLEEPHYDAMREVMRVAGATLLPAATDNDGLDPATLPERAALAVVTPSHQFPTGTILSLARRLALLDWARRANAVIVEDDYDGEFHYDGRPLESLQGLDKDGRVIYVGTFSRTVFPALRIGYLIVPKPLVPVFAAAKWLNDTHSATLEQEALAEFIAEGFYERHLRRLREWNAARRTRLLRAVREYLGDRVAVTGAGAGAHIVLWPKTGISEEELVAGAGARGVGIYGISHCYLTPPARVGAILGFSHLSEEEIEAGIRLLAQLFG